MQHNLKIGQHVTVASENGEITWEGIVAGFGPGMYVILESAAPTNGGCEAMLVVYDGTPGIFYRAGDEGWETVVLSARVADETLPKTHQVSESHRMFEGGDPVKRADAVIRFVSAVSDQRPGHYGVLKTPDGHYMVDLTNFPDDLAFNQLVIDTMNKYCRVVD